MKKTLSAILAVAMIVAMVGMLGACGTTKETVIINKPDDLWGKKIGVQLGTTGAIYAGDFTDAEKAKKAGDKPLATVEKYTKGADAVLALVQSKIDCVVIDSEPAKAFVAANEGLAILDEAYTTEKYGIAVAKGSDLTAKINTILAELKANGTLDNIIKNYIGDDTKGKTPYTSPADIKRTNGELVVATAAEFPPYESKDGEKFVGIDIDLAQAIADKLGMTLKFEDGIFDSVISLVKTGKADIGIAGITITPEREKEIDFTDSYATATQVIIVREGSMVSTDATTTTTAAGTTTTVAADTTTTTAK